jgi:hypothetical protein
MTAFVILAAGPGTRMGRTGRSLHKALVPLDGRAVISHQIGLAPPGARVIICTGWRADQVSDYTELAHPGRGITVVYVPAWDLVGGGPGASLLAAREAVGDDDLIFTSCDTLWAADPRLWEAGESWAGVAPVPAGTPPERWCRIISGKGQALVICDKLPHAAQGDAYAPGDAYVGLAMVTAADLPAFWKGIADGVLLGQERQVTGGLDALAREGRLAVRRISWTDLGDEAAYQRAVAARSGYDWTKPGEVTYVLPEHGRVVKFRADQQSLQRRVQRQETIAAAVPALAGSRPNMLAYDYVPGTSAYDAAEDDPGLVPRLMDWASAKLWRPVEAAGATEACDQFYRVKTLARVEMLGPGLQETAQQAVARVDWAELASGCQPVTFHGDFNLGNIIVSPDGFTGIDWREDFAGQTAWGDWRYDIAKLAAGMIVHWGKARRGDFRPWPAGQGHLEALARWLGGEIRHDIMVLAALSLLNCAPLHAPPLDEVLVARGTAMLEQP